MMGDTMSDDALDMTDYHDSELEEEDPEEDEEETDEEEEEESY